MLRSGASAGVDGMPDSVRDGIPAGSPVSSAKPSPLNSGFRLEFSQGIPAGGTVACMHRQRVTTGTLGVL